MLSFIFSTLAETFRDKTSIVGVISTGITGAIARMPNFWPQSFGEVLTALVSICTVGYILTKWVLLLKKGKREPEE